MNDNDIAHWCDFVRGLLPRDAALRLEKSLETADGKTRSFVEMLRRVTTVGREDAQLTPGIDGGRFAAAVRIAKALGSLRRPSHGAARHRTPMPFSVVFDSLIHASPAGARDLGPSPRLDRLVSFRAGMYSVDVRLEQEADLRHALLVGQVVRASDLVEPVVEVPVVLSSGGQLLDSALTSELGEFQVRGIAKKALTLSLLVDEDQSIEVSLGEP